MQIFFLRKKLKNREINKTNSFYFMPWRLLSTSKQFDTTSDSFQTSNEEEINEWFELTIEEHHVCIHF